MMADDSIVIIYRVKKTTRISKQTAVVPSVDVSSDSVSDGGWGKDEDDLDL